ACGIEFLDRGVYNYEAQHPPLARVALALGPYFSGVRSIGLPSMWDEGNALLGKGDDYTRILSLARAGILPFFWLASLAVFLWANRVAGRLAALVAVLLFTTTPPVLAHAGLATTDMAITPSCFSPFMQR
ncbi:MAG: glycosyl transferase, partial [Bryobacteraceae bacterium]|nr:glycosyl transferase [Bryobacteraceae bacterium]